MSRTKEELQEMLHYHILAALDDFAHDIMGLCEDSGWQDQDLPELFEVLDKHLDKLIERSNEE